MNKLCHHFPAVSSHGYVFALHPGSWELPGTLLQCQAVMGWKGSTLPHLSSLWHRASSDPQRSGRGGQWLQKQESIPKISTKETGWLSATGTAAVQAEHPEPLTLLCSI